MSPKKYRSWDPEQVFLFPPAMQDWLEAIRKAKAELEREARQAKAEQLRERSEKQREGAETEEDPIERRRKLTRASRSEEEADRLAGRQSEESDFDDPDDDLPSHKVPTTRDGSPAPKAQRNFTDPDSRIMKRDGAFLQGYNCQIAVDGEHQIIVAEGVSNQAPDQEYLIPMLGRVKQNTGRQPGCLTADAGYMSEVGAAHCEKSEVDAYIAPSKQRHGKHGDEAAPRDESRVWLQMRAKLASEEGKRIYSRRKAIVEPVFGQIKEARRFRRFSLRGLGKVRGEWTLVSLCHNLLKLLTTQPAPATA